MSEMNEEEAGRFVSRGVEVFLHPDERTLSEPLTREQVKLKESICLTCKREFMRDPSKRWHRGRCYSCTILQSRQTTGAGTPIHRTAERRDSSRLLQMAHAQRQIRRPLKIHQ